MESKDELKESNYKTRKCHYFYDIMKARDIDSENILLNEKIYKDILIYDISYKTSMGLKPLRFWLDKIDEIR